MKAISIDYVSTPSALQYMAQAFKPSHGWKAERGLPNLCLTWRDFQIDSASAESLMSVTDCRTPGLAQNLQVLAPHLTGFRLLIVMLTHPSWPLPIWGALQVRNRLILHHPLVGNAKYTLTTMPCAWRALEKGLEIDLHTQLLQEDVCVWESVVTFYYRGRFGTLAEHGANIATPFNAPQLTEQLETIWEGRVNGSRRWKFGRLTGDYNGLHQWDFYARRFGFPAAFAHPQRLVAQCLVQIADLTSEAQRLDLWIKGPVLYDANVSLRRWQSPTGSNMNWGLWNKGDDRPALIGSWTAIIGCAS